MSNTEWIKQTSWNYVHNKSNKETTNNTWHQLKLWHRTQKTSDKRLCCRQQSQWPSSHQPAVSSSAWGHWPGPIEGPLSARLRTASVHRCSECTSDARLNGKTSLEHNDVMLLEIKQVCVVVVVVVTASPFFPKAPPLFASPHRSIDDVTKGKRSVIHLEAMTTRRHIGEPKAFVGGCKHRVKILELGTSTLWKPHFVLLGIQEKCTCENRDLKVTQVPWFYFSTWEGWGDSGGTRIKTLVLFIGEPALSFTRPPGVIKCELHDPPSAEIGNVAANTSCCFTGRVGGGRGGGESGLGFTRHGQIKWLLRHARLPSLTKREKIP